MTQSESISKSGGYAHNAKLRAVKSKNSGRIQCPYLSLETLLRVSGVGDGPDEAIAVDHRVGALDDVTVSLFFAVLVVGVLVVVHVETELVRGMGLEGKCLLRFFYGISL